MTIAAVRLCDDPLCVGEATTHLSVVRRLDASVVKRVTVCDAHLAILRAHHADRPSAWEALDLIESPVAR